MIGWIGWVMVAVGVTGLAQVAWSVVEWEEIANMANANSQEWEALYRWAKWGEPLPQWQTDVRAASQPPKD